MNLHCVDPDLLVYLFGDGYIWKQFACTWRIARVVSGLISGVTMVFFKVLIHGYPWHFPKTAELSPHPGMRSSWVAQKLVAVMFRYCSTSSWRSPGCIALGLMYGIHR